MAIILVPVLFTSLITNLKYLAPCSAIANISMATGITLTLYYAFQGLPAITERRFVGEWDDLPLFFGTAIFAFEGIALVNNNLMKNINEKRFYSKTVCHFILQVLPLKNVMKKPAKFDRSFGVLNTGMVFVTLLFITCGFFGYWQWGESVAGSLTLNLPQNEP